MHTKKGTSSYRQVVSKAVDPQVALTIRLPTISTIFSRVICLIRFKSVNLKNKLSLFRFRARE